MIVVTEGNPTESQGINDMNKCRLLYLYFLIINSCSYPQDRKYFEYILVLEIDINNCTVDRKSGTSSYNQDCKKGKFIKIYNILNKEKVANLEINCRDVDFDKNYKIFINKKYLFKHRNDDNLGEGKANTIYSNTDHEFKLNSIDSIEIEQHVDTKNTCLVMLYKNKAYQNSILYVST